EQMGTNAGFFPSNGESLDSFSRLMLQDVAECDVLGVWFNDFEDEICNRFAPKADLVELGCLEPFHYAEPWSQHLAGKRVLVVHPFGESIRRQYADRRQLLFANQKVLPGLELGTFESVEGIAGS